MLQNIELLRSPTYQNKLNQCIHCGLCLQSCPTYSILSLEMDSPRGRISLMRAAARNGLESAEFQEGFSRHLQRCLACRACESACPSGVQYGQLVESARIVIESNRQVSIGERLIRWIGTQQLMPYPGRLKFLANILRYAQKLGLIKAAKSFPVMPAVFRAMLDILPDMSDSPVYNVALPIVKEDTGRQVMFFKGCIQEAFLSSVNQATRSVLHRNGYQISTPARQTCCGAAHMHLGDIENAKNLARQNIDAFESSGETIICNAGGCGAFLKEYGHLLADDPKYANRARDFSERVEDISAFLVENNVNSPGGVLNIRATYADSCHLRNGLKLVNQPRALLSSIPGLELVELANPERCCGSAGVYNLVYPDISNQILDQKMSDIRMTGAELIVISNTGCHMQLISGVKNAGLNARVMHVVEVLEWSYQRGEKDSR